MKEPKDLIEQIEIILLDLRRGDISREQAEGFVKNAVKYWSKSLDPQPRRG